MKNFKVFKLLVLFGVLIISISQTWGIGFNKGNVIFRAQGWNNPSYVYLCIGKSDYTSVYQMTRIGSTDLYHVWVNVDNNDDNWWNGCTYFAVIGSSSSVFSGSWGNSSLSSKGNKGYTTAYTSNYDINSKDGCYFFNKNNSTVNGGAFTIDYTSYSSITSVNATQNAKKRDTGTSYSNVSGSFPASIKLKGEYLTGNASSNRTTITRTSSSDGSANSTYGAVVTGTITHTIDNSTLSSDYYLEGWGTSTTPSTSNSSYEYKITAATTVYAFFSKKYTLNFDRKGTYGTSTVSASVANYTSISSGDKVPTGHTITVTASPATGYEVEGWYSDASCSSAYTSGSGGVTISGSGNVTFTLASLNANSGVYCKFRKKTYSITLNKNNASASDNGSATIQYGDNKLTISSDPTYTDHHVTGYYLDNTCETLIADDAGNLVDGDVSSYVDDGAWIYDGDVTLYTTWETDATKYTLNYYVASSPHNNGTVAATAGVSAASSGSRYNANSSITITATPNSHYRVEGWFVDALCANAITGTGTDNTYTFTLTKDTTVYVGFEISQTTITLDKNGGSTGAASVVATHGEALPDFTAHARSGYTLQGYSTSGGVKIINADGTLVASTTYTDASSHWSSDARTLTLYAQWSEIKQTISTSVNYDHGTSTYTATAANQVGITTTSTLTASTPNSAHYTFAGWTLTNLTVTSGNETTDKVITVKATDPSSSVSAVANYNEVLTTNYTFRGGSAFGSSTWAQDLPFRKKSGHSTESIGYCNVTVSSTNIVDKTSNSNFEFKIKVADAATIYGLSADGDAWWYNRTSGEQTMSSTGKNIQLRADVKGTYEIKLDYSTPSSPKITVQFPSLFLEGSFNGWSTDATPFDENGIVRVNLAKGTHTFKVYYNNTHYGNSGTIGDDETSALNWLFETPGSDCTLKVTDATAGIWTFGWNGEHKRLTVYAPTDTTKAKLTAGEYIYFDTRNLTTTGDGWNKTAFSTRFWFKNYASAIDFGSVNCNIADTVERGVYYAKVPADNNLGQIQIVRMKPDYTATLCTADKTYSVKRSATTQNLLKEETGKLNYCDNWEPQWSSTTYCPPMKTAVLADNGTTILAGSGTEADPYQIAASSKIKVTAASSTAFNDDAHMTHKYHFYNGASSLSDQTGATYELTASASTNVTYKIVVKPYNTYNSQNSTKRIKSDTIYYKTVPSYTVTYKANGAQSGSVPVDGNRYITGSHPTVLGNTGSLAIEGYEFNGWNDNAAGTGDHHAVNGSLTIGSEDVELYAEWTDDHEYYFYGGTSGTGTAWGTAANWTKGIVPNDIANTIYILKPVEIPASTTIKAAAVNIVTGGTYSRPHDRGEVENCSGHLSIAAGGELIIAGALKKVEDASDLETKVHTEEVDLYIGSDKTHGNGALVMKTHDGTNEAIVEFYTKSHGDLAADQRAYAKNQFIGTPFNDCNDITYNYHNSWVYGVDYSGSAPAWKRVNGGEGMDPFKGYCVISADAEDHVYWMGGTLVASSNQDISLSYKGAVAANNENVLANSWAAPILITAFASGDFTNADATIYIFNTGSPNDVEDAESAAIDATSAGQWITIPISSGSWGGKTPTVSVIPSMQSFSIYSTAASASVKLNYNNLVYSPAVAGTAAIVPNRAPKADGTIDEEEMGNPEVLRLFVRGTSGFGDNVIMLAREDFTDGFDNGWDGRKVAGAEVAPQMYALTTDGNMAYNCVPDMEGTVLSFTKGTEDATYTFSFEYEGDDTWYLNDLKKQTSTLISEIDTYTFTSMAGDNAARFVISHTPIANTPTAIENGGAIDGANVRKLMIDGTLYIIRGGQMFTADGQVVK